MKNFSQTNTERRFKAYVSILGTTQLHLRNPYIIAWWSAAFPGFGHLLLSKYLRGFALIFWGLIAGTFGFLLGFIIDVVIFKVVHKRKRLFRSKKSEVILVV